MTCKRCYRRVGGSIMSKFNTDEICFDCKTLEEKHPKYKAADEAELAQVRAGNYNFAGVGCPADLYFHKRIFTKGDTRLDLVRSVGGYVLEEREDEIIVSLPHGIELYKAGIAG